MTTFVSYHTRGDVYEIYAARLARSLRGHNARIISIAPKSTWQANVHGKASLMLETMRQTKRPVIWIDADCVLTNNTLVALNYELVAYRPQPFFIAGTVLKLDYTGLAMCFLELWESYMLADKYAHVWDDVLLTLAYVNAQASCKRTFNEVFADRTGRLGIEHYNASKLHRFRTPGEVSVYNMSVAFRQAVVARDYSREWTLEEVIT